MKLKTRNFILTCTLIATLFLGTHISENNYRNNPAIKEDTEFYPISMECDGPDGVMLQ